MSDDNGKRSGRVEPKDYLAIEFLTKLQPLIAQLNEDIPEAKYDARGLATIIPQILQFQEDALGLNVSGVGAQTPVLLGTGCGTLMDSVVCLCLLWICHVGQLILRYSIHWTSMCM